MIPLALSSYTHLWNPVGFPDIFFDEGIYMRRAMNVIETGNPQEGIFYDHPYFGQLILGGFLKIINFPQSTFSPSYETEDSLEMLYLIPRVLMGILAVIDTFLIYKITEKKFGKKVAFIAAILFAVMPMSWFLRRILLDSIMLPFALSSILFALYSQDSQRKHLLIVLSGIFLGCAIFTKIPAFTLMPLIGYLIYNANKKIKYVGLWIVPVFLIPLIWPLHSMHLGEFDFWLKDVLWQAGRGTGGIGPIISYLFEMDVVLMSLGFAGIAYAVIRRELFVILWFVPMILFFATIGFLQYFHWIPLIPIMCIAIALIINTGIKKIQKNSLQNYGYVGCIVIIGVFGLTVSSIVINSDMSSSQFDALSFVIQNINQTDVTTVSGPVYSWILDDVYDRENVLVDYSVILFHPIETENILLISDPHFKLDFNRGSELEDLYVNTSLIKEFTGNVGNIDTSKFPNGNFNFAREGGLIEIKKNW